MQWLRVLGSILTVLFFVGIAGSSMVVVLFLAELIRTILRRDQHSTDQSIPIS